jgi:hypothetical protein
MERDATDAFARLSDEEISNPARNSVGDDWRPIMPAPEEPPAQAKHNRLGTPSQHWVYRDKAREPLFATYRFDLPDRTKEFRPLCNGEWGGRVGWHWHGPPAPRPLFNLDQLPARPRDSVIIVEGEKKVAPATELFPDLIAIAWQGGSGATSYADWSSLRGRPSSFGLITTRSD